MLDQDGTGRRKQATGSPTPVPMMPGMGGPMMMAPGGAPYPMMIPIYMPNMGFYGQPGMMMNPFGQSQFSIPQLDGGHKDPRADLTHSTADAPQTWQPAPKTRQPVTKDEFLERFNKEIYPRLGAKRLVKLQAVDTGLLRISEAGTPGGSSYLAGRCGLPYSRTMWQKKLMNFYRTVLYQILCWRL
jgi:hypothetical protein